MWKAATNTKNKIRKFDMWRMGHLQKENESKEIETVFKKT